MFADIVIGLLLLAIWVLIGFVVGVVHGLQYNTTPTGFWYKVVTAPLNIVIFIVQKITKV